MKRNTVWVLVVSSTLSSTVMAPTPVLPAAATITLAAMKTQKLLYVATGDNVYMLSYPSGQLVGSLNVTGYNLCSDKAGDVFVPTLGYQVLEYAHGSTVPAQTLYDGDVPLGCAVDPSTGDLAVTNAGSGAGEVAIFPHAQPPVQWYRDPEIATYGLCGYDDRGNLFVDGTGTSGVLAELPRGSSTFVNFALASKFDPYGAVQWDGLYITLANALKHVVYRMSVSGPSLKVVGTTSVRGWQNTYSGHWPYVQTWLQRGTFLAQSSSGALVGVWNYPAGGQATRILGPFKSGSVNIYGVALSAAPRQR